jgi:hypothetical protein
MKEVKVRFSLLFFAALMSLCTVAIFARDIEVYIEDTDLGLPLEGATVRLPDGREYSGNEDGIAAFPVADSGPTLIQVSYPGYDTVRVAVRADQNRVDVALRLSGVMEGRELVVEATRPGGGGETVTGRSVAVVGREIASTAEIGIVEDVMSTIRLLPGVGYTGMFNAQPSIRGGDPGDMRASLDGFYIFNPFHWGGGFSIFDPRMVESAQLSHGVFSTRYGHTISGLLDVRSKTPSDTETEFEFGASSSAASFSLSRPFVGRGGLLFMGRVTYYDPVIDLAKGLSGAIPELAVVNYMTQAPYIRSGTLTGDWRFSDTLELHGTAFFGMDGVGANFSSTEYEPGTTDIARKIVAALDYTNYQAFATGRLSWNPRNDMLFSFTGGLGYSDMRIDGDMYLERDDNVVGPPGTNYQTNNSIHQSDSMFNIQGRTDFDWQLRDGLIFAAGLQEMFSQASKSGVQDVRWQRWLDGSMTDVISNIEDTFSLPSGTIDPDNPLIPPGSIPAYPQFDGKQIMVSFPVPYDVGADNAMFATSAYALTEYSSPDKRLGAELGIRTDHFYVIGNGISLGTIPSLSPRLNLDYNVLQNRGVIESLDIAAGTGLFSSMNNAIFEAKQQYKIEQLFPNQSWTSVLGTNIKFPEGLSLNIEGYYRHIFNRMYVPINIDPGAGGPDVRPNFDGIGRVWGIDLMLRRVQSRMVDGWLSYSFNWAKYLDPAGGDVTAGISGGTSDGWYFPSYHRFHNLNLVLNVKPAPQFNIYARLGLASGVQVSKPDPDGPKAYPIYVYNGNGQPGYFVMRYFWPSVLDENNRTSPSLPMDVKFSIFGRNKAKRGMARWEVYFAIENVLGLLSSQLGLSQGNSSFSQYTGEVSDGVNAATYEIPIPIPSFGFRITY